MDMSFTYRNTNANNGTNSPLITANMETRKEWRLPIIFIFILWVFPVNPTGFGPCESMGFVPTEDIGLTPTGLF